MPDIVGFSMLSAEFCHIPLNSAGNFLANS
jgi:hypothetical protein